MPFLESLTRHFTSAGRQDRALERWNDMVRNYSLIDARTIPLDKIVDHARDITTKYGHDLRVSEELLRGVQIIGEDCYGLFAAHTLAETIACAAYNARSAPSRKACADPAALRALHKDDDVSRNLSVLERHAAWLWSNHIRAAYEHQRDNVMIEHAGDNPEDSDCRFYLDALSVGYGVARARILFATNRDESYHLREMAAQCRFDETPQTKPHARAGMTLRP